MTMIPLSLHLEQKTELLACKMRSPAQKKAVFHGRPRICWLSGQGRNRAMTISAA